MFPLKLQVFMLKKAENNSKMFLLFHFGKKVKHYFMRHCEVYICILFICSKISKAEMV